MQPLTLNQLQNSFLREVKTSNIRKKILQTDTETHLAGTFLTGTAQQFKSKGMGMSDIHKQPTTVTPTFQ